MRTDRIAKLDLRSMRGDAHFRFHSEFRCLVAESDAEALGVAALFEAYLTLYEREDAARKRIVNSAFIAQIREAAARRDETFGAMMFINRGMCRHFIPAVREAAARLHAELRVCWNLSRKPLREQTAAVGDLMQELRREKYRADLISARMSDWADELSARNDALDALMTAHCEETASNLGIDTVSARAALDALITAHGEETASMRAALDAAYRLITARINARIAADGAAAYEAFVSALNKIVKKYATAQRHRKQLAA